MISSRNVEVVPDGSVVLITGGTGSFGSELLRYLLATSNAEIRVFSRDEVKQDALRRKLNDSNVNFYLGDVRDRRSVAQAVANVDYVFHAAALKQVPSCEFFPDQAIATNVVGSDNVIQESIAAGVSSLVCLSTDKAVYPINAMGMTKALMEKLCQAAARNGEATSTRISCVRYGNVMYSRGSILPLFERQLLDGGPMTLTDPSMTRFLLSLADSVDLVLRAFMTASSGDIFVRKAPAATIGDIAIAMARLLGKEVEIKEIGFRHGEKLFETLVGAEEMLRAEDQGRYFRIPIDSRGLDYDGFFGRGSDIRASETREYTSHNTDRLDPEGVLTLLKQLPEFSAYAGE